MKSHAPTSAERTENAAFERAMLNDGMTDFDLCRDDNEDYSERETIALWRGWQARAAMQAAKPVAWLHTMHQECDQQHSITTQSPTNPYGKPGRDFSASYEVTSEPLYRAAPDRAPSIAPVKDHIIREVVNSLRDVAIEFHAAGQLRARIQDAIAPLLRAPSIDSAADAKDAARYRYLRAFENDCCVVIPDQSDDACVPFTDALDAAVDRAIAALQPEGVSHGEG